MERRQIFHGLAALLLLPYLPGCGGEGSILKSLNEIMAEGSDLTVISPNEIDLATSDLDGIYVTGQPLTY